MESDSVDCVSLTDGFDDEEVTHHRHPFPKPHGGGAPPLPGIAPTTSVHELLECPVCTNSMYPPIHQVGISYVGILSIGCSPRRGPSASHKVFYCFGQYFCLHFEAFQLGIAPVYMAFLRFMGDENEARNFSYSLEVGGYGRKLTWEGTPRSIRDGHRKVRDSHDGLIIQRNMALFFSGGDRKELKLRVTGRIWKEQPNPDSGVCAQSL
ncbi:hypothetical protein B296_00055811 [Ensete ventricosum]|uniref:Seven-in-absentia protein TRAF-like domain-containing protein n=1 Tax=Ensete ventricosum TaxID=4639 RepID=A0A426XXS6_ENSVE|nr:hypothetical protein B296_00055811 [Ensete ventricosum]